MMHDHDINRIITRSQPQQEVRSQAAEARRDRHAHAMFVWRVAVAVGLAILVAAIASKAIANHAHYQVNMICPQKGC